MSTTAPLPSYNTFSKSPSDSPSGFATHISLDVLQPTIEDDIKRFINEREMWRKAGYFCEILSNIFHGLATISAIYTSAVPMWYTAFVSATLGTFGHVTSLYSKWCFNKQAEVTTQLDVTLKSIGIMNGLPQLNEDTSDTGADVGADTGAEEEKKDEEKK